MKKVASTVFLCFCLIQAGYAQKSFGIKGGLNMSNVNVKRDLVKNPQNRVAYHLGIWKEFSLTPKFFLRPELFYSLKGYHYLDNSSAPGTVPPRRKRTISYNYLSLPLLTGYQPTPKIAVFLGPEISLLGSVRVITSGQRGHGRVGNLRHIINDYKNLDFGITAGLYYKLTSKLNADLRYTYGFSTILDRVELDSQGLVEYSIKESHNKVLQFGLSYTLKTKS